MYLCVPSCDRCKSPETTKLSFGHPKIITQDYPVLFLCYFIKTSIPYHFGFLLGYDRHVRVLFVRGSGAFPLQVITFTPARAEA
jgi:hypothetical protein